ncbi:type VI secretion system baseplate subunit TssK [Thalassoroseus pseudoceratinae]|uniref:type VI secretion system baseplate subunit TssK n=1 Tax=Thalassoroseus pseudoceratinae TaxID=2713176 RepID=UPI0014208DCA|nr:type VI secretion system baseplate subunit TssK [Thalassoroseus pseudoceratinae]
MRHLPVHWHEGLFLRPQHFQAADRFWTERLQTAEQWDHPYCYGLQSLEFSRDALTNSQLQIDRIQARMPDGTLIALEQGQTPDRLSLRNAWADEDAATVDLTEAFHTSPVVRVYLGVPRFRMGTTNVSQLGQSESRTRFVERQIALQDESQGGNDQTIGLRDLNVRLLLSTDDLDGYDVLPIAQVTRSSAEGSVPEIDFHYIPPLLSVSAWSPLDRDLLRGLHDRIAYKLGVLGEQLASRGLHIQAQEPGDLDRILMLGQLNEAHAQLTALLTSRPRPVEVYRLLCEIVGRLALFSPQRTVADIPAYDHDDLGTVFRRLRELIEAGLENVRDYAYHKRDFRGSGAGLTAVLDPQWFQPDWQWFIGVHRGSLSASEVRELLSPGMLDWKFGSAGQVESLYSQRASGLDLVPLNRVVRDLPTRSAWSFYEVTQNEGRVWRDVVDSQSIGVRIRESLIANPEELRHGGTELRVQNGPRVVSLRFALFAVSEPDA